MAICPSILERIMVWRGDEAAGAEAQSWRRIGKGGSIILFRARAATSTVPQDGMKKLKGLEFVITAKSSTIDRASDFDIDVTDLHVYSDGGGGGVLTVAGDLCHENIEFLLWKIILLTTSSLFVQGLQFFFFLYEAIIR